MDTAKTFDAMGNSILANTQTYSRKSWDLNKDKGLYKSRQIYLVIWDLHKKATLKWDNRHITTPPVRKVVIEM